MFDGIRSEITDIELRDIDGIPDELRCLFENENSDLSVIRISELMPEAQSVSFTNLALDQMEQRGDEYNDIITEYVGSSSSGSVHRIEFRSEYLSEIPESEEKREFERIADSEWYLDFECHQSHYLRVFAVDWARDRTEEHSTANMLNVPHGKTFDLVLDANENIIIEYDEDKRDELALIAINTVLRWSEIDDDSFNVDVVDVHIDGVKIQYLLLSNDETQLDSVVDIVRRADTEGVFVEFDSMMIPIRSHRERIKFSFAEKVMAKEVDEKHDKKLSGDLQSIANDAQKNWTSKRHDKVDGVRRELLEKEKTEKEEAEREKAERKATVKRLEHELGLNLLTGCKMVDQPLFRLNAEQLWQCIGWWIDNDVKHQNALSEMTRVCAEYHISGAALCYVFLEKEDNGGLIESALRNEMKRHLTVATMNIIMETMREWMFTINAGALHSASTQLAARLMIQIPIQNLKNVLFEKRIDGKWFIDQSQKEPNGFTQIVQRATGWSKSDCILLTEVLLRRLSLTKDQILERLQIVRERDWEQILPKMMITKMEDRLAATGTLEIVQFVLQTRGTVQRQFSVSVLKLLKELNPEVDDAPFEETFYNVISSALMIEDREKSGRSPWICCFCGNLNVIDIVDCLPTADISKCSLCGIIHQEAVVMGLRQKPTPFLGKISDCDSEQLELPSCIPLDHQYGVVVNEDRKSMDNEHALDIMDSAKILSLERSWVDALNDGKSMAMSIREEVRQIISQDAFLNILCEAIRIHQECNERLLGARRANEYAAKHGILRNQSITVKHVAAILLYVKHTELSDHCFFLENSEVCSSCHGLSCFVDFRIRVCIGSQSQQSRRCAHLQRAIFEAIQFFGDPLLPNDRMLYVPIAQNHDNLLSLPFSSPIFGTKKEYISMYLICLISLTSLCR